MRVDYSVTEAELAQLGDDPSASHWEGLTTACAGIVLGCALNAAAILNQQVKFEPTLPLLLNLIFFATGLFATIGFGTAWRISYSKRKRLVAAIRAKPPAAVYMVSPPAASTASASTALELSPVVTTPPAPTPLPAIPAPDQPVDPA